MLKSLMNLFGFGPKVNFADLKKQGAIVLDVRSLEEYKSGHIKNSVHIPLNELKKDLGKIKNKKDTVIITCCASGMRSASAKGVLKAKGFKEVHNGGAWISLDSKINEKK